MEGDKKDPEKQSYTGIPEAVFVENVDEFMAKPENSSGAEAVLRRLDEQHGKYKLMEYTLSTKRRRLRQQIPDLSRSLEMVNMLRKQEEEIKIQYALSDQIFAKANIKPTKTVCLWLGANVMLEYTLDDAEQLLTSSMVAAKKNMACVEHDLDFLRDQWTTTEVNMARVYNWDVKRRRANMATA